MIDAFLSTCSQDEMRFGMAVATLARLKMSSAINLRVIRTPEARLDPDGAHTVSFSDLEFRIKRRQIAEALSSTPVYLMADDDILPFDSDFVEKGLAVMEHNPDYASGMYRVIGVDFSRHVGPGNDEIEEFHEGGGLWLMRKGVVTEWPTEYNEGLGWLSRWETKMIQNKGMRPGLFKKLRCNHLGLCFSTQFWNENGYGPVPIP